MTDSTDSADETKRGRIRRRSEVGLLRAQRLERRSKRHAEARLEFTATCVSVEADLLVGRDPDEFTGAERSAAAFLARVAERRFELHHGNATWLTDVDRAVLGYLGTDPARPDTWRFTVPAEEVPRTGLVESLVGRLGEVDHLLVVVTDDDFWATEISRSDNGPTGVQYPWVVRHAEDLLASGGDATILLGTWFTRQARPWTADCRAWKVHRGTAIPFTGVQLSAEDWLFDDQGLFEPYDPDSAIDGVTPLFGDVGFEDAWPLHSV